MKSIKWISSSVVFIAGSITTIYLEKVIAIDKSVKISIGLLTGGALFLLSIMIWLILYIIQERIELKGTKERLRILVKEVGRLKNNSLYTKEPGTMSLLMALSQDTYEPLKFELLKQAAYEHKNVLAAVILAGFYKSGLKTDNHVVLEQDPDIAFDLYKSVNDCDNYGITDWLIGFSLECNQTSESNCMTDDERKKTALQYYSISAKKGFPKAENSIGKFYHYGWVTGQKNPTEAIGHYQNAAKAGDVYALINCGHSEMKQYYTNKVTSLYNAQEYFQQASNYDNSEAWLWLGIVSEERIKYEQDKETELLIRAKDCYLKSFDHTDNKYSASGQYKLGCLIKKYSLFEKDLNLASALEADESDDLAILCFSRAYSLFHNIYENNKTPLDRYKRYYDNLKLSFRNINVIDEHDIKDFI